jgi:electron transfer flavoprotein-quinone oxidoreductase
VLEDMRTYARAPKFLERSRMYGAYGELAAAIFRDVFSFDGTPHRHLRSLAVDALKGGPVRMRDLVSDGWAGVRAL